MPRVAPKTASLLGKGSLPATDTTDAVDFTWKDTAYGVLASPIFAGAQLASRWLGASPGDLQQRDGRLPPIDAPSLWLHGASAGEMNAASALVRALRAAGFAFSAGYTTTNEAGVALARQITHASDRVSLAPWDAPRCVERAMDCWKPRALFLVETELWPRLVYEAKRRGIPVFSVSARIYPRDVSRYRLIRPFIAPTLRRLTRILVQDETERARFVRLGASDDRCCVVGDLKHALPPAPRGSDECADVRVELGVPATEPVVACGSVHADEMLPLIAALSRVDVPSMRIVIAPRHAGGIERLLNESRRRGWRAHRRSLGIPPPDWQLLIWDTYGELRRAYAMATVAVVGGTFAPHGGHNLLEPIAAGAPVLFGPHTQHCAAVAAQLTTHTPDACVRASAELTTRLSTWMKDHALRTARLDQQRHVLPDAEGIANRYVAVLSPWLREVGLGRG